MSTRKNRTSSEGGTASEQKQALSKILEDCKKPDLVVSSKAMSKLMNLGESIELPLSSGILSALLSALTNWDAPSPYLHDVYLCAAAELNTLTISALTFLHHPLANCPTDKYSDEIIKAWPKVHLWVIYYFYAKIIDHDPEDPPFALSMPLQPIFLAGAISALLQPYRAREVISASPLMIEILTKLWLMEKQDHTDFLSPYATNALEMTLRVHRTDEEQIGFIDRIVKAAGGKIDRIVNILMKRTREEFDANKHRSGVTTNMLLIYRLCGPSQHAFRLAFLNAGVVPLFTEIIRVMAETMKTGDFTAYETNMTMTMRTALIYLAEHLESVNGFAWATQAVEAGLIKSFIMATAFFHRFSFEEKEITFSIMKDIFPKYLVYRSFIQAIDNAFRDMRHQRLENFITGRDAIATLSAFQKVALERNCCLNILQMEKTFSTVCDNQKCKKANGANEFRKCSGCKISVYCSVACQTADWNSGEHKEFCKQVQKEVKEGLPHSVSRSDTTFFHHLAIRDARRNRPKLKRMAKEDFPGIRLEELTILLDYTVYPMNLSLQHNPEKSLSPEAEGGDGTAQDLDAATETRPSTPTDTPSAPVATSSRNRRSTKKRSMKSKKTQRFVGAKQGPSILGAMSGSSQPKATKRRLIIQSQIPNGADHIHHVTTTFTGGFWDEMVTVPANIHITQVRSASKKGFRALRQNKPVWDHTDAEVLDLVKEMGNDPDYIYDEVDLLMNVSPLQKGVRETKIRTASGRELLFRTQAVEIGKFRRSGLPMPNNLKLGG
ncbi:hypothetical protein BDN72DRAFT_841180 [Pluteus cervinus]|uniref:Uncharacterized protein n=1 Tax=Pluteus cervinus TaxID=181527 RepID=A0ACD3AT41_9AGAR|nr:hypothetical protein BDN72DRAFT_841180 [Pluteus cervinus]